MLASIAPSRLLVQATFVVLAALVGWAVYGMSVQTWLAVAKPLYVAVIGFLFLTIVFGRVTRGSARWIHIGGTQVQASEFAKPVLLLAGTAVLAGSWPETRRQQIARGIRYAAFAAPLLILVLIQPDLGTTIILGIIALSLVIASGLPRWICVLLMLLLLLGAPSAKFALAPYQVKRLEAFLDPYADPRGAGYNVIQATTAIGSGQIFGRGLGHGTQSHLKFLPERQTDFIYASLVEELGLVGGGVVIMLYAAMLYGLVLGIAGAKRQEDYLLLAGTASWLFFQATINIGMNLGIAPVTGITLPFLSAGGSSLVASSVTLALAVASLSPKRSV